MLTPRFELSQTDDEVTFVIHAPYANIKDTLIEVDGADFRFYSTPYYLRLNLPGEIVENEASKGSYDCEKGDFILKFSKVHKGEYFENLDMITTLLAPSKRKDKLVPTIEVISNPCATSSEASIEDKEENDEDESSILDESGDEWYTKQNPLTENVNISLQSPSYGFGNKISGALASFEDAWVKEIIDLPSPDKTLPEERTKLRERDEINNFDEDHYMFDLMTPEEYAVHSMEYEAEWEKMSLEEDVCFNDEEKDLLKELPNKEYLLDNNEVKIALFSMVDILYANCYNRRLTEGENHTESGWTINKLSSTLSWFQSFTDIHDVIVCCVRRCLCFPLVRNWNYAMKVFEDVKKVIKLGKKYILKQFCEIHSLFNNSNEPRYILNQLYIKDYLIWLQQVPDSKIKEISALLENELVKKEELGLHLEEIEAACYLVQNENEDDDDDDDDDDDVAAAADDDDDDLVIENDLYTLPDDLEKLIIGDNNESHKDKFPTVSSDESDSDSDSTSSSSTSTSTDSTSSDSTTTTDSSGSYKSTSSHRISNIKLDSDDESN